MQGLLPPSTESLLLQVCFVAVDSTQPELFELPKDLQSIIQQYQHLFDPPVGLPSPRACNHLIPLVPGSKPVAMRPYRYPPKLKDEMEKQVADMLEQGIIQPSVSSFSSPVLLVPKKDGGYRFCVDYR